MQQLGIVPVHLPSGIIIDIAKITFVGPYRWTEGEGDRRKTHDGAAVRFTGGGAVALLTSQDYSVLKEKLA